MLTTGGWLNWAYCVDWGFPGTRHLGDWPAVQSIGARWFMSIATHYFFAPGSQRAGRAGIIFLGWCTASGGLPDAAMGEGGAFDAATRMTG